MKRLAISLLVLILAAAGGAALLPGPDDGHYSHVSVGSFHSCGIRKDGSAVCWGSTHKGALDVPAGNYRQISAGYFCGCGVRTDGSAVCWGDWNSQLPLKAPTGEFRQVTVDFSHACGIRADGTLVCWGENEYGGGDAPEGAFVDVQLETYFTCGLLKSGIISCWGHAETIKSIVSITDGPYVTMDVGPFHVCGLRADGVLRCSGIQMAAAGEELPGRFIDVSVGHAYLCAVRSDHALICRGYGVGESLKGVFTPVKSDDGPSSEFVPAGTFASVDAGTYHLCAVRTDGTVSCWGGNKHCQSELPSFLGSVAPGIRDFLCERLAR